MPCDFGTHPAEVAAAAGADDVVAAAVFLDGRPAADAGLRVHVHPVLVARGRLLLHLVQECIPLPHLHYIAQ